MRFLRVLAAFVAGYLISAISSILLFRLSHHDPHSMQPVPLIVEAGIFGIVFALLAGYVAATISNPNSGPNVALAVAVAICIVAVLSAIEDRSGSHWSQWVAILGMAPAAYLGGSLRKRRRSAYSHSAFD